MDAVNVMAAYQPVVQLCGSPRLKCRHNNDRIHTDEQRKTIL
jgi:hypothetical protein